MAEYQSYFRCVILSAKKLLYEGEIKSLFVTGDQGEYEILAYHYPLVGVVKGDIILDWKHRLFVKEGVIRFFANECNIIIEEKVSSN